MNISIALASDNTYAQHLGCTLASILLSSTQEEVLSFFILDGGISQENKDKIRELKNLKNFEITFLQPSMEKLKGCPSIAYFTINTYLRLLLPEMLPEVDKLLYLDSDMIVTRPLAELWKTDLEGKMLGVVPDFYYPQAKIQQDTLIPFFRPGDYFNSGMLLMDLRQIREGKWFEKTLEWIQNTQKLRCADQDGLNALFRDHGKQLPWYWNIQILNKLENRPLNDLFYARLQEEKGIIHYIGSTKPWYSLYNHPLKSFYWEILAQTPWKDNQPENPSLKERIRFFLRNSPTNQKFRKWCKKIKQHFRPKIEKGGF